MTQPALSISGLDELKRKLIAVANKTRGKFVVSALAAGAAEVLEEAQRLAPFDTGELAQDIQTRVAKRSSTMAVVLVGNTRRIYYAHMQEFGTAHHAAQPYLRPAFDAKKVKAFETIGAVFWSNVRKATVGP